MRYEHIEWDASTKACASLLEVLEAALKAVPAVLADGDLINLRNNLAARLQRRDIDPHCPRNVTEKDWLDA